MKIRLKYKSVGSQERYT